MNITDFPGAIAQAERAHLKALQQVRHVTEAVEARKAQFGAMVAADTSLTNEAKRKAAKAELELTDPDYLGLQQDLLTAKDAATEAMIEVTRLSNLFKVERLIMSMKIAMMQVQGDEVGSAIAP